MKAFWSLLIRKWLYDSIPADDLMSKQRFSLFRIFTYTAFFASISTVIQIQTTFEKASLTEISLIIIAAILLINFFAVKDYRKLPIAYAICVLSGFLELHIQAYDSGGVRNTGTMYMCIIMMTAFMLLGPRFGKWFTVFAILNVAYFYWASTYTQFTSYRLFGNDLNLINQDALITFMLALFLVAAQSNYLHSSKNVIIERITEQKDQLAQSNLKLQEYTVHLERTNKELDKFASIVSHDLKAPLRAIGNLTGWIEEDAGDAFAPEIRTHFDMIKQRVQRMEDLINAILDYSRADRRMGDEETIDTSSLVTETLDFIGRPENVSLTIQSGMPVINSDRTRLVQVFSNLLGNAIKYNDKPDIKIDVACKESKEGYTFSVKDNGPGIDPLYHDKIFIIFQTLNRRDDVESTGVGLAIVKKIIDDEGGKIWVESVPGKGAEFNFFWPRLRKHKDTALIAATIIV